MEAYTTPLTFDFKTSSQKIEIARHIGLSVSSEGCCVVDANGIDESLRAARVHCLSKDEMYFLGSFGELQHPLNHRNEAAAVSLLLQRLQEMEDMEKKDGDSESSICMKRFDVLKKDLRQHCEDLWPQFAIGDGVLAGAVPQETDLPISEETEKGTASSDFEIWANTKADIKSKITIEKFGDLRGCAAKADIDPGELILSISRTSLIFDETIAATDLGKMLYAIPGLSSDNILIIFTMIDRHEETSFWAPFWKSLPRAFLTGLSFPGHVVKKLSSTAAGLEIRRGQQHLRSQYEATLPLLNALLQSYPDYFQEDWFTFESYTWAAELWYGYAFEVEFPPNPKSKTVMVPFACHVNHSPWPHVVRYGKLNPHTDTLDYPAFRPCKKNRQVFISYGPVPNLKLITYYGFCIENNPHDMVPITIQPPDNAWNPRKQETLERLGLSLDHNLRNGPLSRYLLACLRLIVATEKEMQDLILSKRKDILSEKVSDACEVQAIECLRDIIHDLQKDVEQSLENFQLSLESYGLENGGKNTSRRVVLNENGLDENWHTTIGFCCTYLEGQRQILVRSLHECDKILNEGP